MAIFKLNEGRLREAFAGEDFAIEPFDPPQILADELHGLLDNCLDQGIIEKRDPKASIAIYPLAESEPEPLLAVNPGEGPMLLGGRVDFVVGDEDKCDEVRESVAVLRALVEDANALYAESEVAKAGIKGDGSERECCQSCLRVHGPIRACLIGVIAACAEERGAIRSISPAELASMAADPLWEHLTDPAVDYVEARIVAARAAGKEGPDVRDTR